VFLRNDGLNNAEYLGLCEAMTNASGFQHWLTGDGSAKNVCWDTFDPGSIVRDQLKDFWREFTTDRVEEECEDMEWNTTKDILIYSIHSQLFTAPIGWISNYWGEVYGDTTGGNKNVSLWKVDKNGECYCSGIGDIILKARDRSDFNPGQQFTGFGITWEDDWFLWLQDNTPVGTDYNISDFQRDQVEWRIDY
jgi:hypothetical protein